MTRSDALAVVVSERFDEHSQLKASRVYTLHVVIHRFYNVLLDQPVFLLRDVMHFLRFFLSTRDKRCVVPTLENILIGRIISFLNLLARLLVEAAQRYGRCAHMLSRCVLIEAAEMDRRLLVDAW